MKSDNRFMTAIKALFQLGFSQTAWFALYRLGLLSGHFLRATPAPKISDTPITLQPPFQFPERDDLLEIIGKDGLKELLNLADEITEGRVRLFGGDPVPLKLAYDQPLQHWTAYEKDPSLYLPFYGQVRDVKFIWEPARFGWAFTLGRAYHLTGEERYAKVFWEKVETFLDGNPANLGPHWVSAQEVSLRLMAFLWCSQVFSGSQHSTPARTTRLTQAMIEHAERIPPTLVYARSQNNNHLLSETAALFSAGLALPDHPQAGKWRKSGWKGFHAGLRKQIDAYGEYAQHSSNYQRLMLQLSLWMADLAERHGLTFPRRSREALETAAHWSFSLLDPLSGGMPNLGANDGAYVLPLTNAPFADHRPVIQAAARRFMGYSLPAGSWDEMSLWFGLPASKKYYETPRYLGDAIHGRKSWGYLRALRFRSRPSHADQLHFDLWWQGLNITRDAGTYLYNVDTPWDNRLTHTTVHNTVSVDGLEQMTRAGRFLYLDWARGAKKKTIEVDPAILESETGWQDGYRKLGIRHERTATVFDDEHWQVQDCLLHLRGKPRQHSYRLHWLLPDWDWEIGEIEAGFELRLRSPRGELKLQLTCDQPGAEFNLVRAGKLLKGKNLPSPVEGWFSATYGQKEAALSCSLQVSSLNDVKFSSLFIFPES